MPLIGMGTAQRPFVLEAMKSALLHAIELGYRHFDTGAVYMSEQPLADVVAEALNRGLIKSRTDLFITSKLWCSDAHAHLVLPALQKSLKNLNMEYLDLYLLHWPLSLKPGESELPFNQEDLLPMDFKFVWEAMEECQRLGLTKSVGVSNFSCKKLADLLETATIPPAVNQVEMHAVWQQKKLRAFCATKGIHVSAYSPLGAKGTFWGSADVMDCDVLKEIAEARGKSVAQIALRWVYEQGASLLVKSFNKERMGENLKIFDWVLSDQDKEKISQIPQRKVNLGKEFIAIDGPYKSVEELWDGEI
eukprot:TRINITY_DN495_c1_g1_i1.p1 TRINITY_DN495_c1_g1~~TRINITY_DN495_c1_g1_i1.p1  ORF type:complete len:335 (+),score=41.68 TRINITY_DN495_c1_g1_i1:92-1006(+)